MNDEYIRRVEAEEAIEEYCCRMCKEYSEVEGGCVSHAQHCEHLSGEEILKPVKSTDVQPVKHGKWISKENAILTNECTLCKRSVSMLESKFYKFCPYCGARMDGDSE